MGPMKSLATDVVFWALCAAVVLVYCFGLLASRSPEPEYDDYAY